METNGEAKLMMKIEAAKTVHNILIAGFIEILGKNHETSRRLAESSAKFWKSIEGGAE